MMLNQIVRYIETYFSPPSEKKCWEEDHILRFDSEVREYSLKRLNEIANGRTLYLTKEKNSCNNVEYDNYFVTDGTYFIEFSSDSLPNVHKCRTVNINKRRCDFLVHKKHSYEMNEEVRERIRLVLGACNYSLFLRNSEHVANFIVRGVWHSSQIVNGHHRYEERLTSDEARRIVNQFPSTLRPHVFKEHTDKLYSFITDNFQASGIDYFLDPSKEDAYNILMIGPTGAGKSHLINVLFNQKICDSEASLRGVTREIYFVRGSGHVEDSGTNQLRNIVVADTIGMCDREWNENEILNLTRGRVSTNIKHLDVVFIVFRLQRLLDTHISNIKKALHWLGYYSSGNEKRRLRFVFVGTHAEYINEIEEQKMRTEAQEIFKSEETSDEFISLIFTGFLSEENMNELTKHRVQNSWINLKKHLTVNENSDRINTDPSCSIL